MQTITVVVCLPITDRQASFAFYRDGLGFEPVGEPAEDGVPEPLQFALNDGQKRHSVGSRIAHDRLM